jgi:hypothetical protein
VTKSHQFYRAWWFLHDHPKFFHVRLNSKDVGFEGFFSNLAVSVHCIDPMTGDNFPSKTPKAEKKDRGQIIICLEAGPYSDIRKWKKSQRDNFKEQLAQAKTGFDLEFATHDWRLDCWGYTYEDAILKMARKVRKYYGTYKQDDD